ncbi:trypsin-like serine peptidase [Herbidospora cretacea]|uniref:trypsin-like serine peptidase n=1 Tax=Herbidospora cretacea TaxID=28444 RepID=UPI000AE56683|nr:hypothetical protein [Herbidospora cretacea]
MVRHSSFVGVVALALPLLIAGPGSAEAGVWANDALAAGDAVSVAGYWTVGNSAALRRATPLGPENDRPAFTRIAPVVPAGEPGTVAPGHEEGYEPPAESPTTVTLPKTVGKVFFLDHEGKERWCSATSIESGHRNVVATAAHCVHDPADTGKASAKWVFIPGYYGGKAPYGVYVGAQAWTHHDFDTAKDYDKDYAFVNVYNGLRLSSITQVTPAQYAAFTGAKWIQGGLHYTAVSQETGRLGDNVGGQGLRYNARPDAHVYAFGYPAGLHLDGNPQYTGETIKYNYGRLASRYTTTNPATNNAETHIGVLSSWTPGADGSPMLSSYEYGSRLGYIEGVVSFLVDQDGDRRYDLITSAYFDGESAEVYRKADEVATGSPVP